ncbi:glycosyltransferase, partial [Streptococcus pyogenes]
GLPIASTSVGGIPEVVEDGLTGLLSLPGDAEALAANMDRVMSMAPAEREAMVKAARERVIERFSLRAVLDQWEALYDEID